MCKTERALLVLLVVAAAPAALAEEAAEPIPRRIYEAARVAGEAPTIDGRLEDSVWSSVEWSGDFVQRDPSDGDPPSQQTRFKCLYDDSALYFAFWLHDDPELVTRMLARRDGFPGDWIEVNIDSYFDHRTAFSFTLSVSGTQGDELVSNDGSNWDSNWNPVWTGATEMNAEGWTAEMRIPLSQLRFGDGPEQTWGLQVHRRIFRLEERSTWQHIPKDVSGWVSRFGELRGLRNLRPKRRIELLPYALAGGEWFAADPDDPFSDGGAEELDAGLDGKIGITSNLTLDLTINPDFGQVEADPSQVNLTAFETYFEEKRPFFIEGRDIFDLRLAPAITGGSFTRDTLFYSRRIGHGPTHEPDLPDGAYMEMPVNTKILGAFKLSGKTARGLSVGLLESVTAKERAEIDIDDERSHETVEPATSYFVGRLQQDFRGGDTQIGGMITAVHRDLEDDHLDFMTREAYSGGVDLSSYFSNRDYLVEAAVVGSLLRGSEEALYEAQTSSARYYQRPGNDSETLDPTRTSLSGHAGSLRLTRTSNHELMFQTGVAWRSPGFEINDLGFMRNADQINQFTWVGYSKRNPFSIFDRWSINANQWLDWDFGGNFLGAAYNVNSNAQFRNKYTMSVSASRDGELTSNTELRGGPASLWPGAWSYSLSLSSDHRRKLSVGLGACSSRGDEESYQLRDAWVVLTYRPTNAIRLSLSPSYSHTTQQMQYIDTVSFGDDDRYLFGSLEQRTAVLTVRLDYSITPNLTVQYYGSPFLSTGRYSHPKRIIDPRADRFRDRFHEFDGQQITFDQTSDTFHIDEDRNGSVDYSFENPGFDTRELNSNLVIRWEYRPGSTVYLVWSQVRESSQRLGDDLDFHQDMSELFSAEPHDVVLLKVSKWLSL